MLRAMFECGLMLPLCGLMPLTPPHAYLLRLRLYAAERCRIAHCLSRGAGG